MPHNPQTILPKHSLPLNIKRRHPKYSCFYRLLSIPFQDFFCLIADSSAIKQRNILVFGPAGRNCNVNLATKYTQWAQIVWITDD